jgi:hypothetical protein
MRPRSPFVTISALGIAILAAAGVAVSIAIGHAQATQAMAISSTMTVGVDTFAPPPSDAVPALTAAQAWAQFEHHASGTITTIAPSTTVRLGLLTVRVGPYCGAECHGLIVRNGIAYQALDQLAWGYGWLAFPHRHSKRMNWVFLDASTGQMINGVLNRPPGGPVLRPQAGPPPTG